MIWLFIILIPIAYHLGVLKGRREGYGAGSRNK